MKNCNSSARTTAKYGSKSSLLFRQPCILAMLLLCAVFCQGQQLQKFEPTTGFIYSPGIQWTENKKQDSVIKIIIEKDTMIAVRNLLIYCLQEKSENDNANILLSMINLDYLKTIMKSKEFDFYLNEYKKAKAKNKKDRAKSFPQYGVRK